MYLRFGDPSWDSPEQPEMAASAPSPERRRLGARAPAFSNGHADYLPVVQIHGVSFNAVSEQQCITHVLGELDAGRGGTVVTLNMDHLRRCQHDVQFAALVEEADLTVADGMPLVWASRLQGTPVPERITGSNLMVALSEAAAVKGRSVFLLGGAEGTAEAASAVLRERCPQLRVVGTFFPPPGFRENRRVLDEMREALATSKPDIVFVALGAPRQEHLIADLRALLPGTWWLGVGISFSFVSGQVRRAPNWMQRWGIEWVYRLCQEPRRLFRRYIVVGVPFGLSLLTRSTLAGISERLSFRPKRPLATAITNGNGDHPANHDAHPNGNGHINGNGHSVVAGGAVVESRLSSDDQVNINDSSISFVAPVQIAQPPDLSRLSRLKALVLLGGSVRPSPLVTATGRSILDLPLNADGTLLNSWLAQAEEVSRMAGLERLPVRVLVNQASSEPRSADERYFGKFRVERDLSEYRGTGGVLRDVAADYADDDLVLVANAAQVLLDPLPSLTAALLQKGGDVMLIAHEDGTPSGVMLVSCKAMRLIASAGFVDMKEQALPQIALGFDVQVLSRRRPTGLPVRTLEDYVRSLRLHHRRRDGKPIVGDPLAEDFTPAFSLVEKEATVDGTSRIHDSVVLAGATVEAGAALVRCVVCPGAVVRRDRTAVDQLIVPQRGDRPDVRAFPVVAQST
jgi:N-acetylglucosaminyldiphosphoundecaprenol N-acetyl-beta-D-mannosaminyltransferase